MLTIYPNAPNATATRNRALFLEDHDNVVEQVYTNPTDNGYATGEWLIVVDTDEMGDSNPQKYSLVSDRKIGVKN